MLVPCFLAGSIVYEIVGTQAKLRSDKFDDLCRDQFAWSQHPAGIAQDTQLQGEAEPVVSAPTQPDMPKVFITQRLVLEQIRL